jgi:hypothetical protein
MLPCISPVLVKLIGSPSHPHLVPDKQEKELYRQRAEAAKLPLTPKELDLSLGQHSAARVVQKRDCHDPFENSMAEEKQCQLQQAFYCLDIPSADGKPGPSKRHSTPGWLQLALHTLLLICNLGLQATPSTCNFSSLSSGLQKVTPRWPDILSSNASG